MSESRKKIDKFIFKYARKSGIKRVSGDRVAYHGIDIYSGKDPVTGTKWEEWISYDENDRVVSSIQSYKYPKDTGSEELHIYAAHAGEDGYKQFTKYANKKKYAKRIADAIGPNEVWDSGDAPYLASVLDQLPGLVDSPTSIGVMIGGSDYFFA